MSDAVRRQKAAKRRKSRRKRIIITVIAVIAALALIVVGVLAYLTSIGRINLLQLQGGFDAETAENATAYDRGRVIEYEGHRYRLNENMVSICIIGQDKEGSTPEEGLNGQADVIMVVALDTETGDVAAVTVPRDSMVEVNRNYLGTSEFADTKTYQICLAYSYGQTDEESSELVCTAVSRVFYNIPMNYYYTIDFDGVIALADVVGGVTLEAQQTIPGTYIYEGDTVTLSGDDALRYVRWRDQYEFGTSLERQARQQQFVKALGSQLLSAAKGNPTVIVDVFNALSEYATTNLTASEVTYLATVVAGKGVGTFDMTSLQGEEVHNDTSEWDQFILDKDAVFRTVLDVYYTDEGEVEGANASSASAASSASSGSGAGVANSEAGDSASRASAGSGSSS